MTFQILFQLLGLAAFLFGGVMAHSQWSRNSSRERLVFSAMNFIGAGFVLGLIVATLTK